MLEKRLVIWKKIVSHPIYVAICISFSKEVILYNIMVNNFKLETIQNEYQGSTFYCAIVAS